MLYVAWVAKAGITDTLARLVALSALSFVAITTSGAQWIAGTPCFEPGAPSAFDGTAVKDPTVVFHDDRYHLFYTARGNGAYSIGYTAAPVLDALGTAPRYPLTPLSRETGYASAPQVFYFEPQDLWYLVYQTYGLPGDMMGRYTPMYITTATLGDPDSWSVPRVLANKFERNKWIDFWVICDEATAYLFYTRDHKAMYYMTTSLDAFPEGFANPVPVKGVEVHEAACVYRVKGKGHYAMLVEINDAGRREYHVSTALTLLGPWSKAAPFAHGDDLQFGDGVPPWTNMVSHGELIRSGANQQLEVLSLDQAQFLVQGTTGYKDAPDYTEIPWRLGIITNYKRTD